MTPDPIQVSRDSLGQFNPQIWMPRLAVRLAFRAATARFRTLPQVYLLGATKSATTSLARLLWEHPAHVAPLGKELMYLQQLPGFVSNYEHNRLLALMWGRYWNGHARFSVAGYRKFFPLRFTLWRRRRRVGAAFTSDSDPFNLYCAVARGRIAALGQQPRFIVALRDPVARAFSDYNMHRERGAESRTFEQCIEDELCGRVSRFRSRFVQQGIYAPHLEEWFNTFPRERFLVLRAEDLFGGGESCASKVFDFLGLPATSAKLQRENAGTYSESMPPRVEARLRDLFRPHNERLYALLGRNMQW